MQAARTASQTAQQNQQVANQAVQAGAREAQRLASAVPIEGYDELNVGEIVARLESLSAEELEKVLQYEQNNKNLSTLIDQINEKSDNAS